MRNVFKRLLFLYTLTCFTNAFALKLLSTAFKEGQVIPVQYTCQGHGISPKLTWTDVPAKTKTFVLIVDDPDAPLGIWDHWILFNIPADVDALEEGVKKLPTKTQEGRNSWGKTGYGAPCPPTGTHRYFFKLYAVDTRLNLTDDAEKTHVERAMQDHVLQQATLMGKYQR